ALARAERALDLEPTCLEGWELAARLRAGLGDAAGHSNALERAAELLPAAEGAVRLEEAARALGDADPDRAVELLQHSVALDPAAATAQAELTIRAADAGLLAEAESAARRAIDLDTAGLLDPPLRARVAREGGVAAWRMGNLESAANLLRAALDLEPECAVALESLADINLQFSNPEEARPLLERRLALTGDGRRVESLNRLGRCLERVQEPEAALARFLEARDHDPSSLEAHEGCVRLLEAAGSSRPLVDALRAQARAWGDDGAEAGFALARAAQHALEAGLDPRDAETWLRDALRLDATHGGAWLSLARLLARGEREQDALDAIAEALETVEESTVRAELAVLQAETLEARGDRRGAALAYAEVVRVDPSRVEDGLASARLYRGLGEWRAAADVLEAVACGAIEERPERAATVFHQLGRLLAGPLEDLDSALGAYERALECAPDHSEAEHALADLLVHQTDRRQEAIERHLRILRRHPHRIASVRALLRLRAAPGSAESAGLALLAAVGAAAPEERERARGALLRGTAGLPDPLFEQARAVARAASGEIALALETSTPDIHTRADDPVARFRARALARAAEVSAAALLPLPTDELRTVLTVVAGLGSEAEAVQGNGHLVNALASALGRRARRRVRRALGETTAEEIAGIDFEQWRAELFALAAAEVLERRGGELRTALLALLDDASGRPPEQAELTSLVEASPAASALFRRMVRTWLESVS
ncbi:MAG: tetratricopeptide repeat protein, partial [Myxococcota bacterium]